MPTNIATTEHTVPYVWSGKARFMMVRRIIANGERFFVIRTKKGEYTLQFYDMRWNVISPRPNNFDRKLLVVIGDAIMSRSL